MNRDDNTQGNFFDLLRSARAKGLNENQILQITQLTAKGMKRYCVTGYYKKTKSGKDALIVPHAAFARLYDFING